MLHLGTDFRATVQCSSRSRQRFDSRYGRRPDSADVVLQRLTKRGRCAPPPRGCLFGLGTQNPGTGIRPAVVTSCLVVVVHAGLSVVQEEGVSATEAKSPPRGR